jgi:hypothetical protein
VTHSKKVHEVPMRLYWAVLNMAVTYDFRGPVAIDQQCCPRKAGSPGNLDVLISQESAL